MLHISVTHDRLILTHKPVGEAAIAIASTVIFAVLAALFFYRGNDAGVIMLVFAVSGPVYLYFFLETREITFDRAAGTVTLASRSPRGATSAPHPLAGLARAEVHRVSPSKDARAVDAALAAPPSGNFRAVLIYEDGSELPLAEGYTGGNRAFEEVRAVNTWLDQG